MGVGVAVLLLAEGKRPPAPVGPGQVAPSFELPALDGTRFELGGLRGRVVLLNFWATWCKPCEQEMPAMERLYDRLRDAGFELLAVSVDDDLEAVRAFRSRLDLTFPILHDAGARVARAYQTTGYPESFLIDQGGRIVFKYVGPRDWDALAYEERIRRLLDRSGEI